MTVHALDRVCVEKKCVKARALRFTLPVPPAFLTESGAPSFAYERWKRAACAALRAQSAGSTIGRIAGCVAIAIEIADCHPRRGASDAMRPILALLADPRVGVIDGTEAHILRSVSLAWSGVDAVRLTITRVT